MPTQPKPSHAAAADPGGPARSGGVVLRIPPQTGRGPDRRYPDDAGSQMTLAWDRVLGILAAAGMAVQNLVKIEATLTEDADLGAYRAARKAALGSHKPGSTLTIVPALAEPGCLVEIEGVAIR